MQESKVIVITGGASGIGRETAKRMAKEGLRIAIVDINQEQGERFVQEELAPITDAAFYCCDVTKIEQIYCVVDEIYQRFGQIYGLLNCAAISLRLRVSEITEADWDLSMAIDLKATFFMSQACAKYMSKGGGGCIVNFSSILSTVAHGRHTLYGGAKEGLNGMTRELAVDLCKDNIRVISVLPTYIVTPMIEIRTSDKQWVKRQLDRSLSKEMLYPRHIAEVLYWLMTSETKALTGSKLNLDTGYLNFRSKIGLETSECS